MTKLVKGVSHTKDEGKAFALKVVKYLKNTVKKWKDETGIEDITDKESYTNSYHLDSKEEMDTFEKLKFEGEFQKLSNGGAISYIDISKIQDSDKKLEDLIKYIYDNVQYVGIV